LLANNTRVKLGCQRKYYPGKIKAQAADGFVPKASWLFKEAHPGRAVKARKNNSTRARLFHPGAGIRLLLVGASPEKGPRCEAALPHPNRGDCGLYSHGIASAIFPPYLTLRSFFLDAYRHAFLVDFISKNFKPSF
jgi:hypothetical protein